MTQTQYAAPKSIDEAVALMAGANGAGRILAGGTDLLVQMRAGVLAPGVIVDVKKIAEMTSISETAGSFRIGAAVPAAVIGEHAALKARWPGVVEALNLIGSKQVQGRASAGGNLCNASPAADSTPAFVAAGAILTVQGPKGRRELPVEKLHAGPGRTTLERGEIVVSITLPPRPSRSGDAYLRLIPRTEMDIAVVGCGVSLTLRATSAPPRASASAPSRRPSCSSRPPARRWSARVSSPRRSPRPPPPAAPPASRSTTSAAPSSTGPRSPGCCSSAPPPSPPSAHGATDMSKSHVSTTVNGEPAEYLCDPTQTMLDVLRDSSA
jgi:CO/xanthine dehydrogenase FAD-binding subunit